MEVQNKLVVMLSVMCALFLSALDQTIVATALPSIKTSGVKSIDYKGSLSLVAAILPLMLGLLIGGAYYPWISVQTLGLFAISAAMFFLFVRVEKKAKEPILPPSIFRNKIFLVAISTAFITSMSMFGAIIFLPVFVQFVLSKSATNTGLILTPMVLSMVTMSTVAGQLMSRLGKYKFLAIIGSAAVSVGILLLSFMGISASDTDLFRNMVILGIGLGMSFPTFMIAVQNAFEHSKIGVVTASLQFFRNVGGLLGVTIFGALMIASLQSGATDIKQINPEALLLGTGLTLTQQQGLELKAALSASISNIFFVGATITGIGFLLTLFLKEIPLRKTHMPPLEEAGIELAEEEGFFNPEDEPRK